MKIYTCSKCNNLLYFENVVCLKCGHTLGFDPEKLDVLTLSAEKEGGLFKDVNSRNEHFRFCQNNQYGTCNWLIPEKYNSPYCLACQLNRTIPTLSDINLQRWKRIEVAKHRLVYSLLRLNLPVKPKVEEGDRGIAFDFLADTTADKKVLTGHNEGVITLNIEEADEQERVRNKLDMGEKYRTLLGHFRHEIGHYYWDVRIKDHKDIQKFHELFGDESKNYEEALKTYYANGASANWPEGFISPYATAHPWEDWAETWAHYLHLMDALETAYYFGIDVHPKKQTGAKSLEADIDRDPYTIRDFEKVFKMWLPLTFALNSLNRSMGHADFYPFVIAPQVVQKLQFVHDLCKNMELSER
ncbi:MAG TPA: putative zinc-binding peptidase [Chryseolinea sp.]|nr:putative zinc-binding peptidase [Chryseolinea sp.]